MSDPLPDTACPDCGAPLAPESPQSLCPACLMRQALASRTVALDGDKTPHLPPPSPEEIADRFPGYEILECLGRGGMGAVYKARQKSLNRLALMEFAFGVKAVERAGGRTGGGEKGVGSSSRHGRNFHHASTTPPVQALREAGGW